MLRARCTDSIHLLYHKQPAPGSPEQTQHGLVAAFLGDPSRCAALKLGAQKVPRHLSPKGTSPDWLSCKTEAGLVHLQNRSRSYPSFSPGVASQSALVPGPPDVASQWGTSRAPRPSSAGTQTGTQCAPADLTAAGLPLCPAVRRASDSLGPQQDRCRWWSLWGAGGDGLADRLDIAAHGAPCCSCCVSQTRRSCVRRLLPFVLYL